MLANENKVNAVNIAIGGVGIVLPISFHFCNKVGEAVEKSTVFLFVPPFPVSNNIMLVL